ncbi:MAG: diguanylate cyclase [Caldiserica bacterium]|nr:diguanylate cyclase [Caldisericota bacterium]
MAVTGRDGLGCLREALSALVSLGRHLLGFDAWALIYREEGALSVLGDVPSALWEHVRTWLPEGSAREHVSALSVPPDTGFPYVVVAPIAAGETGSPGYLLFAYRRPRALTTRARSCAAALAHQAAVLLRERRHRERLRTVYRLSGKISRLRDEAELIAEAVEILRKAFRYGHVGVFLREGEWLVNRGGSYSEAFARDEELFRPFKRIPLDRGICGRVLRTGESALVPDVRRDPDYVAAHPLIRSELVVPIVEGGEVLGVINLESPEPAAFTDADRELLESLGRQIGVALRELRHRRELEAREGFLRALNETTDYGELLRYILERAIRLLAPKADAGSVIAYDEERRSYRLRAAVNRPLDVSTREEYREDEVLHVFHPDRPTLLTCPRRGVLPGLLGPYAPGSTISIPVRDPVTGKAVAFLIVNSADGEEAFGPADAGALWAFREEITAVILRARNLERIREMAFRDPLTRVYNRHYLERLVEGLAGSARAALVLVDIDSFSEVNDRFGHLEGDRVLRGIARLASVRGEDAVVRYGGDEFLILMPNAGFEDARAVAERLRGAVARWDPGLAGLRLSISFGIAAWDPRRGTLEEALARADRLLYRQRRRS